MFLRGYLALGEEREHKGVVCALRVRVRVRANHLGLHLKVPVGERNLLPCVRPDEVS